MNKYATIKFPVPKAMHVAKLLDNLELIVCISWTSDELIGDAYVTAICRLNTEKDAISPELQIEKLRENTFIKVY